MDNKEFGEKMIRDGQNHINKGEAILVILLEGVGRMLVALDDLSKAYKKAIAELTEEIKKSQPRSGPPWGPETR